MLTEFRFYVSWMSFAFVCFWWCVLSGGIRGLRSITLSTVWLLKSKALRWAYDGAPAGSICFCVCGREAMEPCLMYSCCLSFTAYRVTLGKVKPRAIWWSPLPLLLHMGPLGLALFCFFNMLFQRAAAVCAIKETLEHPYAVLHT